MRGVQAGPSGLRGTVAERHRECRPPWAQPLEINEYAINKDGSPVTPGGSEAGADSTSSALFPDSASLWAVRAQRLPDALAAHRKPDQPVLLKIDLIGVEDDLLPAIAPILADPKVTTYISFPPKMLRMSLAPRDQWETWTRPAVQRPPAASRRPAPDPPDP